MKQFYKPFQNDLLCCVDFIEFELIPVDVFVTMNNVSNNQIIERKISPSTSTDGGIQL